MRNIYPFGKAPFVILIIAIVSGVFFTALRLREAKERPDLVLAIQATIHKKSYLKAIEAFNKEHNCKVQLQVVQKEVLMGRLQSAMQAGCDVPDLVEILEGSMGFFTRGKLENVGFIDLTDLIREEGLLDESKMVQSRYALWSSRKHIFALPHDVHPSCLCYNIEWVDKLNVMLAAKGEEIIDVTKLKTWPEFVAMGQRISKLKFDKENEKHYAIELPDNNMNMLVILFSQYGEDLFDEFGRVSFDTPGMRDVIIWYIHQVEGDNRISFPIGDGQNFYQAMKDGLCLFFMAPDWRTAQFEQDEPKSMKGKIGVMPMPQWPPRADGKKQYSTGTWGGTGLAITKNCVKNNKKELAWEFAKYLYLHVPDLGERFLSMHIVPPVKAAWKLPEFQEESQYFKYRFLDEKTGEVKTEPLRLGAFFASIAENTPPRNVSAYSTQAQEKFLDAFYEGRKYFQDHGDDGLSAFVDKKLKENADYIRGIAKRNVFLSADADPKTEDDASETASKQ